MDIEIVEVIFIVLDFGQSSFKYTRAKKPF